MKSNSSDECKTEVIKGKITIIIPCTIFGWQVAWTHNYYTVLFTISKTCYIQTINFIIYLLKFQNAKGLPEQSNNKLYDSLLTEEIWSIRVCSYAAALLQAKVLPLVPFK